MMSMAGVPFVIKDLTFSALLGGGVDLVLEYLVDVNLRVAQWSAPTQHAALPFERKQGDQEMLFNLKVASTKLFNIPLAAAPDLRLFIGPQERAVELTSTEDVMLRLKDGDELLVKVQPKEAPAAKPAVKSIHWDELANMTAQPIASGALADVYKAEYFGAEVAVKRFRLNGRNDEKTKESFRQEAQLLGSFIHPSICRLLAIIEEPISLVIEFANHGSLYDLLHVEKKHPSRKVRLQIAHDIATALLYLHSMNPVHIHRDLKSANVLLVGNHRAKLGDSGVSRVLSQNSTMTGSVGTTQWCVPEIWNEDGNYTEKVDVYSFGMIMWELFSLAVPFADFNGNPVTLAMKIMQGSRPNIESAAECPAQLKATIVKCWSSNPAERPSVGEIADLLKKLIKEEGDDIPDNFICPLFLDIMRDPCITKSGLSYCRECLEQALSVSEREPQTHAPMKAADIIPNFALRDLIDKLKK